MNNGKGDSPRNCFSQHYRENYDHIFNTITGEDWRREIQRGRKTKNKIKERSTIPQRILPAKIDRNISHARNAACPR